MLEKILLLALLCCLGSGTRVTSTGRTVNVNTQEAKDFIMNCEVEYTNGDDGYNSLIYWYKIQDLSVFNTISDVKTLIQNKLNPQDTTISDEMVRALGLTKLVTTMASLAAPFNEATKFAAKVKSDASGSESRKNLELTLKSLVPQDSGRYICAVNPASGGAIDAIFYDFNVMQEVGSVTMTGRPTVTQNMTDSVTTPSGTLIYHQDRPGFLQCQSQGGYPLPSLSVFIGEQRQDGFWNPPYVNYTLSGDQIGRQLVNPIQTMNSTNFRAKKEMNDMKIKCTAEVRNANGTFNTKTDEKTMIVYYQPEIECHAAIDRVITIPLGGKDISVRCNVKARPAPQITWSAKSSNLQIQSNDPSTNSLGVQAATETSTLADTLIAKLTFKEVKNEHYQDYDITAENVAGRTLITVRLENGEARPDESTSGALSLSSLTVLLILISSIQLLGCFS